MNPRRIVDFLKSKFGLFCLFVLFVLGAVYWYGNSRSKERQRQNYVRPGKTVEVGRLQIPLDEGIKEGLPEKTVDEKGSSKVDMPGGQLVPFRPAPAPTTSLRPSRERPQQGPASLGPVSAVEVRSSVAKREQPKPKKVRAVMVRSSIKNAEAPKSAVPPDAFVAFGTLLKCKLVNTVDSASMDTPIIAQLLEDVWQNGKRVVPANTLIHGRAQQGRLRDRINASGAWKLVWQDGRQLTFTGVALDREYDHGIDGYGITDGSAGLRGRIMASDDLQEMKMLAAAALSGFARGTQDRATSALGSTIVGSTSNGVREGVGQVFDLYAQRVLKEIEQNGYFVRVAAGKEFYLYVSGVLEPAKATVAGQVVDQGWPAQQVIAPAPTGTLPPEIKAIIEKKEGS